MLSHSAWPHRLSPSVTVATYLAHAQSEESGIEPGQIATITGSLVSLQDGHDHYDTDHTDLGSDTDEVELRRELLRDVSRGAGEIFFKVNSKNVKSLWETEIKVNTNFMTSTRYFIQNSNSLKVYVKSVVTAATMA